MFRSRGARPRPFCVLADPGPVGVDSRASEEPVEVAVGGPSDRGAADDAEHDVEDCVSQGAAYGEAHHVQHDLYSLPPTSPHEADDGARDRGAARCVEELVFSPAAVDDLRRDHDQREGRDEVGDLVVAGDGLEEVPQKAGPVQACADQDEHYYPPARHPFNTSYL